MRAGERSGRRGSQRWIGHVEGSEHGGTPRRERRYAHGHVGTTEANQHLKDLAEENRGESSMQLGIPAYQERQFSRAASPLVALGHALGDKLAVDAGAMLLPTLWHLYHYLPALARNSAQVNTAAHPWVTTTRSSMYAGQGLQLGLEELVRRTSLPGPEQAEWQAAARAACGDFNACSTLLALHTLHAQDNLTARRLTDIVRLTAHLHAIGGAALLGADLPLLLLHATADNDATRTGATARLTIAMALARYDTVQTLPTLDIRAGEVHMRSRADFLIGADRILKVRHFTKPPIERLRKAIEQIRATRMSRAAGAAPLQGILAISGPITNVIRREMKHTLASSRSWRESLDRIMLFDRPPVRFDLEALRDPLSSIRGVDVLVWRDTTVEMSPNVRL